MDDATGKQRPGADPLKRALAHLVSSGAQPGDGRLDPHVRCQAHPLELATVRVPHVVAGEDERDAVR